MRRKAVFLVGLIVALFAIALAAVPKKATHNQASRNSLPDVQAAVPKPSVSPNAPFVVPRPQAFHPPFDWFSWETFIAINWPAATDPASGLPVRGQPDLNKKIGDTGWRVWETFKADWETFGNGSVAPQPTAWTSWQVNGNMNPCTTSSTVGKKKSLVMVSKMDSVISSVNEANAGPLIDSNGNYVRYEILLNSAEYNTIIDPNNKWYLSNNIPLQVSFPSSTSSPAAYGALEVKAAWRELVPGKDDVSRYYSVSATILDPGSPPTCRDAVMGLIGLHIAVKTLPFKEWVWATFEQEDNVPDGGIRAGVHYSLNNGTTSPATSLNGFNYPPNGANAQTKGPPPVALNQPLPADPPVQVTRFTPVDSNVAAANQAFHDALSGTKWVHYNLVADQWPTDPTSLKPGASYPTASGTPFPNDHVANTSAETYFQNAPASSLLGNSCMQCHFQAAFTDFSWTLNDEAFPRPSGTTLAERVPGASSKLQLVRRANAFNALRASMQQRFSQTPTPKN
jgi:hypothetical protein